MKGMKLKLILTTIFLILISFIKIPVTAGEIHDAINNGTTEEVKNILKSNRGSLHATDEKGRTPLHLAIMKGDKELAEFLIKQGADVNARDNEGKTPRNYAVRYGKKEIESILISKNASWNRNAKPGYATIQGIESQIPGIHITGHPPTPPKKVFHFAYATAGVLFVIAGIAQYFINKKFQDTSTGENKNSGNKTKKTIFTVLIVLLYFILLEGIMQVYIYYNPYQVFIPDPQVHWKINPAITKAKEKKIISKSRCGFLMDQQYGFKKKEGAYRILCLGDSQTLGMPWVKSIRYTYAKQLQNKFLEELDSLKIEVMNMGVSGYSSFQGLIYMKNIGLLYNPDCIIVGYGYHDGNGSFAPDKDITTDNPKVKELRSILYRSQVYLMIRRKILERRTVRKVEDNKPVYRRVSPEDYVSNLEKFVKMGKENNFKVVFFTVPHIGKEGTKRMLYVEEMRKTAAKLGVPLIDGVKAISEVPVEEQEKYFFRDGAHFTKAGNEFIAEVLFKNLKPILEKQGVLK